MTPAQVSIGQRSVEGHILGSNLTSVTNVSLGDGISVASFQSISANDLQVNFTVADNAAPGTRTIVVNTSTGSASSSAVFSVSTNRAPRARFTVSPAIGSLATVFTFDASNSIDPSSVSAARVIGFAWNFGDGATANGKTSKHKFRTIGRHTVSLTITDGAATDVTTREIEVEKNPPPEAHFSVSPDKGSTVTTFHFDASRSKATVGRIVEYRWNFGDGKRGKGEDTFHTYAKQGEYDVELAVEDNRGKVGRLEKQVEVEKSKGRVCNSRGGLGPAGRFTVISRPSGNTLIGRFESGEPCQFYYRCGDVRKGGLRGWGVFLPEKWVGVMCEFIDLGNGTAQIKTVLGNYTPAVGDKLYAWPQLDCTTRVCGR
jgi:PKD repeat protein